MKRVDGLFDHVVSFNNLLLAQHKAARGKRHNASTARFEFYLEQALLDLHRELNLGHYQPGEFSTFEVRDPKRRQICAAPFRDRVVHHAICHILEPYFERRAIFDSYACRIGKGTHAAIDRAQQFSRRYAYFLKCDIAKFFASVDHLALQSILERLFKDKRLLELLVRIVKHSPPDAAPGRGLPIGNLTSQHFANLYLGELDHFVKEKLRVKGYLRYMDDFLLFADDKPSLHHWLADLTAFIDNRLSLRLKERSTLLAPVSEGIPFLGVRIYPGMIRLNQRARQRFRKKALVLEKEYVAGLLAENELSSRAGSLYAHVAQADTWHLRRRIFGASIIGG